MRNDATGSLCKEKNLKILNVSVAAYGLLIYFNFDRINHVLKCKYCPDNNCDEIFGSYCSYPKGSILKNWLFKSNKFL